MRYLIDEEGDVLEVYGSTYRWLLTSEDELRSSDILDYSEVEWFISELEELI